MVNHIYVNELELEISAMLTLIIIYWIPILSEVFIVLKGV